MKFKDFLQTKGISEADFATKNAEELASLYSEFAEAKQKELNEAIEKKASKEEVTALQSSFTEAIEKANKATNDILKAQGLAISKMLKDGNTSSSKGGSLADELKANKDALRKIAKGVSSDEVVIKANTIRTSITNNQNAYDVMGIGQLDTARHSAYDLFTKIPVSESNTNGVIRYYDWDSATTVRAAASIAETGTFPSSTAKWVKKSLNIEKVGDSLPVSEEFFEDEQMFAAELDLFLRTNVEIKRNNLIVNGDGITPNLKGIVTTVGAYTPVASGITDANIYDLITKVSESITKTGGAKYQPNFAFMNITDINKMKLKKDSTNNYIIPPFVSRDGSMVNAITVLEENEITANTMVLGDSRFGRIYEKIGIEVSRGLTGTQFTEDMETLKVRLRLAFLIRDCDLGGFKKVTSISAALTTLAT